MPLKKVKQKTVVDQVMDQIKELIASGEYKPGDKIPTEMELAKDFGLGRSSIREAIKIFNYLGVLESRAAIGTIVKERSQISTEALTWSLLLGDDEFEEMVELRGAIELRCMCTISSSIKQGSEDTLKLISTLEDIVEKMKIAANKKDYARISELDLNFHFLIIASAGNELFNSLYETLRAFLKEEVEMTNLNYQNPEEIWKEHRMLLDALKTGDNLVILSEYEDHLKNIVLHLNKK
ncbi:MAG: FadR family transcriptional regulator [Spirochaetaceae bacterium]|nr:FadR family transcriptional regulator [Spirochaetaceae bacterium]